MYFKRTLLVATLCLALTPGTSFAADSCPEADALKDCVDMNIATCREDASCTSDREQAYTSSDMTEATIALCCPRAAKKEANCLKRQRRRLVAARKGAPTAIKAFLRQLRSDVKDIDCETNTTSSF